MTLFDEINSNPHSNVGHNSWLFEKLFFVRAIDEDEEKNKNIKINNFFIMSKMGRSVAVCENQTNRKLGIFILIKSKNLIWVWLLCDYAGFTDQGYHTTHSWSQL